MYRKIGELILIYFITAGFISNIALAEVDLQSIASRPLQRIAFGSCAMQFKPQPVWNTIADQKPDLFLFLGDNIYADFDGKKPFTPTNETLKRDWGLLKNEAHFKRFRKQVPLMATWDNHDYGKHDGGAEFKQKELTKKHFLDFFNEPKDSVRRKTSGIYEAKVFGPAGKRLQVIMLDTRYFKGAAIKDKRSKAERAALGLTGSLGKYMPNRDTKVTLLGEEQWNWLAQQLQVPADIRLLVSSTQLVADKKGMDEWGNYPLERQRLFDLITESKVNNLIILSGNVHYSEISKIQNGKHELVDFTSSGLTHTNKAYAKVNNPYRVANAYDDLNFGIVEINWDAKPSAQVKLLAKNLQGETVIEYAVSLPQMKRPE